ncbi:hypothetical protein HJC23_007548 [Cyclotella cryptica]|uniref:HSF-type DNA-binding domain-containing protein n=1 Tax=Cyclotella cryptica TaxID=29204 RepID=A0ABD3QS88_9STRA|eukprot:CCRYP_002804-RA/>CCRYP_002804-RA protein AED:0.05 eAED:0.05 QI:423/1/1/1/1/1/2/1086/676
MNTLTTHDECSTENNFPKRLMSLLDDEDVQKVMHWLPCGQAFEILDPELCAGTVLKNHFNSVKFESFIVRLKKWGFDRTDTKVNGRYRSMTFSSELFRRDKPHLCNRMRLKPNKPPKKAKATKQLSHLFDARRGYHHTTPQMSPTITTFGCKNSEMVMQAWQYHFWQNNPLSTKHTANDKDTDSAILDAGSNSQSAIPPQNIPSHTIIHQGVTMNRHCMEHLTSFTDQNQQNASRYQTFHHPQAADSMSHLNIDVGVKSEENNVTNSPAMINRHHTMDGENVLPPQLVTTPVAKTSIRPAYGRTNSEPIFPRTTKGGLESPIFRSQQYVQKSYSETRINARNKKALYKSFSCDESPEDYYRQQRSARNGFREDIEEPAFVSEVMDAKGVLYSSSYNDKISRHGRVDRREDYFVRPSICRRAQGLENKRQRSMLNSDPTPEQTHMALASSSFPGFHPIDSSQHTMNYLPNSEGGEAQDRAIGLFQEGSTDLLKPIAAIDLFEQNRHDDVINQYQDQKACSVDYSRRDSFFDEVGRALYDGIDLFTADTTENNTQWSGSAEYSHSKIKRGVAFEATQNNCVSKSYMFVTPEQQNPAVAIDDSQTNNPLCQTDIKNVQPQRQVEIPDIKADEVRHGGSLASSVMLEAEDLDLQSLASMDSENNTTSDRLIDFIEKTIAD